MKTQSRHLALAGLLVLAAVSAWVAPTLGQATGVTAFEGARVIVGDGRPPIENASFVVSG